MSICAAKPIKAPFPYFGGKSKIAPAVWARFGRVRNYVEPFAGSLATLFARPQPFDGSETVNDYDGFIANFWRAVRDDPYSVARHADWPVNENDLHARHAWITAGREALRARLEGDPTYYDARTAGYWLYCQCLWIGAGLCSGRGPWGVVDRQLVHLGAGQGVNRQRVHLGDAGRGVNRQLVHLGDAGRGVNRKLVNLGDAGRGVNRKRVNLGDAGQEGDSGPGREPEARDGCADWTEHVRAMMCELSDRLRRVRVCCGDWSRVCGPTPTSKLGLTAVFLDPPYSAEAGRDNALYTEESTTVAHAVRAWCLERGGNPKMRIALCGYDGEGHEALERAGWSVLAWKTSGGYASQNSKGAANCRRERIWFSPHCEPAS